MHRFVTFAVLPMISTAALFLAGAATGEEPARHVTPPENVPPNSTFCNPLNLEYCFRPEAPNWREAADPVIALYKGDYYLFPSKSSGYWWSSDLVSWKLVPIDDQSRYHGGQREPVDPAPTLPVEGYGPAITVLGDTMYYTQQSDSIYKTTDPKSARWTFVRKSPKIAADCSLFADDDGRVYDYAVGTQPDRGIYVTELDPKENLKTVRGPLPCMNGGTTLFFKEVYRYPWEAAFRRVDRAPEGGVHICRTTGEGAQMFKRGGLYYLQVAISGTQYPDYRDYAFVSRSPWGPFEYLPNNPVSYRKKGFCAGAGNTSVFADKQGRYWRAVTTCLCVKHMFERRVALYPGGFDKDNLMYTDTYLGDLPQYGPGRRKSGLGGNLVGWMLLSYKKKATASSTLDRHPAEHACDENIRTWWSAKTGEKGEWLALDLAKPCRINAVQINYADQDTQASGRKEKHFHQYVLEVSGDGAHWLPVVDKSANTRDVPHDYVQLDKPVTARHLRLRSIHVPAGGKFALHGLRVFGNGLGEAPDPVGELTIERDPKSDLWADLRWPKAARAEGYVVRWGIAPDKLYQSYDVRDYREGQPTRIYVLTAGMEYYFTVDSFNDSGVTRGTTIRSTKK